MLVFLYYNESVYFFILFGLFAHTNSTSRNRTRVYHRSFNPAMANVSELSNDGYAGYTKILADTHHFNARVRTSSDDNKNEKSVFRAETVEIETLTDFIQEVVNILNTYEDTAFEDFFHILGTEIRKYYYTNCKFSELIRNQDTISLLATALKITREKSVSFTKTKINKIASMIKEEAYGNDVKTLLNYINSLYRDTEHKFHKVLEELNHYRTMKSIKTHKNLIKVIRNGVRDILFDHYSALDRHTRRELKERIEQFWKQFKNSLESSAKVNDSREINDAISKSAISSFKVSKNVMSKDKGPELNSKNNIKNLTDNRGRRSKENDYQQSQGNETEKDDRSDESEIQDTDYTTDVISSGQSLDSSSNSIKESQERHRLYNTEQYLTLYTEKQSFRSATKKKTEIIPTSAEKVTKKATGTKRPTTTSAQQYSSEDALVDVGSSNHRPHYIKQGITHHISERTLKVKFYLKPQITQDSKERKRLITTDKTRPTIQYRRIQAGAEAKTMKAALTKPPPRYSKSLASTHLNRLSNKRRNTLTLLPEDDNFNRKQQQKYLTRPDTNHSALISGTSLNIPRNFNEYVIKRLDTLEQEFKDFRSMLDDNHTHEVEESNVTDKYEVKNKIGKDLKYNVMRLNIENPHLNHEEHNKENNHGNSTGSYKIDTESSTNNTSFIPNVTEKNVSLNTTVINNKNTTEVNNNKVLNKDKIIDSKTTVTVISLVKVTNSTKIEYETTTAASTTTKPTAFDIAGLAYFLDHINDGMDIRM